MTFHKADLFIGRFGDATSTTVAYNPDGTLASRTDMAGNSPVGAVAFGYDWAGRLTSVTPPAAYSGAVTQSWRLDGLLKTRTMPTPAGGSALSYAVAYDVLKRPTQVDAKTGATTLGYLSRAYTRSGATASEGRSLPYAAGAAASGTDTYAYDALGRLSGESGPETGGNPFGVFTPFYVP